MSLTQQTHELFDLTLFAKSLYGQMYKKMKIMKMTTCSFCPSHPKDLASYDLVHKLFMCSPRVQASSAVQLCSFWWSL